MTDLCLGFFVTILHCKNQMFKRVQCRNSSLCTSPGVFKINNVSSQANGDSSKVKVKVRVNAHGLFNVVSASMYEKLDGTEEGDEVKDSMEVDEDAKKKEANNGDAVVNGEQVS